MSPPAGAPERERDVRGYELETWGTRGHRIGVFVDMEAVEEWLRNEAPYVRRAEVRELMLATPTRTAPGEQEGKCEHCGKVGPVEYLGGIPYHKKCGGLIRLGTLTPRTAEPAAGEPEIWNGFPLVHVGAPPATAPEEIERWVVETRRNEREGGPRVYLWPAGIRDRLMFSFVLTEKAATDLAGKLRTALRATPAPETGE